VPQGDLDTMFYRVLIAKLVDRRRALGISQIELDDLIGVSDGYVAKWERLLKIPTPYFFTLWAHALGVTLDVVPFGAAHGEDTKRRQDPETRGDEGQQVRGARKARDPR
jgi:transcriptional regulator with XRE-family HTH domain